MARDEDDPPCTHSTGAGRSCNCGPAEASQQATAPARRLARNATPGASSSGQGRAGRSLRQASIVPYLVGTSARTASVARARVLSPGRHLTNPILVPEDNQDDRTSTRVDTPRGNVFFTAGSVCFALAPGFHPTMIAVVQHPIPKAGPKLEWNTSKKRKLDEAIAAEEAGNPPGILFEDGGVLFEDGDIFFDYGPVERDPVASTSTSTARQAVATSPSGRKRRCVDAPGSAPVAPTPATSKGKARAL